jgi:hypothetical protein
MAQKHVVIIVIAALIIGTSAVDVTCDGHKNQSYPGFTFTQKKHIIMRDRVDVEATIDSEGNNYPASKPIFDVTINISRRKDSYKCESIYVDCDTKDDVLHRLKETIVWKGKYLLVPTSCGGGNAWRCDIMQVFMVSNDHLIRVGEATIDADKEEHEDGKFHDIYDKLEVNDLTCHADAPGFGIVMYEIDGKMVVNLKETWEENQEMYKENQSLLDSIARDSNGVSVDDLTKLPPLLDNSVLSKYCQRQDDLNRCGLLASLLLDHALKAKLDSTISLVIPGELP